MKGTSRTAVLAGALVVIAVAALDQGAARSGANKGPTVATTPSAPSPVPIPYPNNLSGDTGGIKGKTAVPQATQKRKMTIKFRPEHTRR